ncbi:AsnC family transcriptional regulator [Knoellia sinensis KCTC 19936]|uniref:AsnC family transcriptional regulator n=1 Tax=Knoellia sinensis KCTC 19936 TaxID=1385520 RepID=A0A0A0J6Q2_9MICO|nr:Lrp/AsnC family transcriptional regulator [Knoellia sinensis]KGN31286.1 AsnC family transcriptional regulator [Knoellia sinensis KCTC 19936]
MTSDSRRPGGFDLQNGSSHLDDTNRRILTALADDPRLSTAALARKVAMSTPAVRERVKRLEEAGVIRGYRLDIDPAAIGLPVAAWVRIRPGPGQLPKVAELAAKIPHVSECHRISGEDCFLVKVHVARIEDLEGVLDQFLLFGQTTSSFVVSSPVPPRAVLPPNGR